MGMNNYPVWWDTTLTIYNRYEDPQTQVIHWHRTVVKNCFWKYVGNKVTVGDTTLETNNTICRIPKDSRYKDKYEWVSLPNDMMSKYFTLGQNDIIVKGEVTDEINEYQSGKRSTDLLSKYKSLQGCILIEQVGNNTGIGRCNEHYYVSGV